MQYMENSKYYLNFLKPLIPCQYPNFTSSEDFLIYNKNNGMIKALEVPNQQLFPISLFTCRNRIFQLDRYYFKPLKNLPDISMVVDA